MSNITINTFKSSPLHPSYKWIRAGDSNQYGMIDISFKNLKQ